MLKLATLSVVYCVSAFFITFTDSNVITNRNIVPPIHTHSVIKHDNPLWTNTSNLAPAEDRKLRLYQIYKKIAKLKPIKKKKALKFIEKNLPKLIKAIQPNKKKGFKKHKKKDLKKCVPIGFLKELEKAGSPKEEYDYIEDKNYLESPGSLHNFAYRTPLAFPPMPIYYQNRRILIETSKPKQPDKHRESPLFIVLAKLLHSSSVQPHENGLVVKQPISNLANVRNKPMKVMTPTAVKHTHVKNGGLIVPYQYSKRVIPVKEMQNDVMIIHGPYPNLTRLGVVKNRIILPRLVLFKTNGQNTAVKPTFHISYGKNYLSKQNHTSELMGFGGEDTTNSEIMNNNKLLPPYSPDGNVLSQNFLTNHYTKIMLTGLNRTTNKEQSSRHQLILGPTTETANYVTQTFTENKFSFGGTASKNVQKTKGFHPHNLKQNNGFSGFISNFNNNSFEIFSTTESYFPNQAYFVTPQTERNANVFLPTQIPEKTAYIHQHFNSGSAFKNQENDETFASNSNKPSENIHLTNLSDEIYKIILLPTPVPEIQHPKHENSLTSFKTLFHPNINSSFDLSTNSLRNNVEFVNVDRNRMNILKKIAAKINDNTRNRGKVSIPKVILPLSSSGLTKNYNSMYTSYNPPDRFRNGKEIELQNVTTENYYKATENGTEMEFVVTTPTINFYNATENVGISTNISTFITDYKNNDKFNKTKTTSTTSSTVKLYSVTENVVEIGKSE